MADAVEEMDLMAAVVSSGFLIFASAAEELGCLKW